MADSPIYTEADCKQCNKILFNLNALLEEFDKMEAIGVDTSEGRLRQADLVNKLHQFKKTYFPGR